MIFVLRVVFSVFFFFNDTATTEIYTLSLHDALPILGTSGSSCISLPMPCPTIALTTDRKSTRLNSSHQIISYAVFCLKKKNKTTSPTQACWWLKQSHTVEHQAGTD